MQEFFVHVPLLLVVVTRGYMLEQSTTLPLRIDDITCDDKELSLIFLVKKKLEDLNEDDQYSCFSADQSIFNSCESRKVIIEDSNTNTHKLIMHPEDENEDIKLRYEYIPNKSKSIEIKHVTIWTNGTYIPIPIFIYDKTMTCSFESYTNPEHLSSPFSVITTLCNSFDDKVKLNFGPIIQGTTHSRQMIMLNFNPVALFVSKLRVTRPTCDDEISNETSLKLVPLKTIDIFSCKLKRNFESEMKTFDKIYTPSQDDIESEQKSMSEPSEFMIPPNSIVYYNVEIDNPQFPKKTNCNDFMTYIHFIGLQFNNFSVPISYQLHQGNVTILPSDGIQFPPSTPGIIHRREIKIKSTFDTPIFVKSVTTSDPNRIFAKITSNFVEPNSEKAIVEVATVMFDKINPFLKLNNILMDHFNSNLIMNHQKLENGNSLPVLTYFDVIAWYVEESEWRQQEIMNKTVSNLQVSIDTNINQNIQVPVRSSISRPKLVDTDEYIFNKIEIGTEKRGKITIHNPTPFPIEVSFYIASSDYLKSIINEVLSESKLHNWKILCDKMTFFDPIGRNNCEDLGKLYSLSESKRNEIKDYFFRSFFNFISNGEPGDQISKMFVSDIHGFLQKSIKNITDTTLAFKPPVISERKQPDVFDKLLNYWNKFKNKIFLKEKQKLEGQDEVVEEIKLKLTQMLEDAPSSIKEEIKGILNPKRENFYIEHSSKCKRNNNGENKNNEDCHRECNGKKFIIPGFTSLDYSCFHFHPTTLMNFTESYLLIKNNLTYIYPIKLVGSSGKGILKITNVATSIFNPIEGRTTLSPQYLSKVNGIDIFFNLTENNDLFKVKAFEKLNKEQISDYVRSNLQSNKSLTASDLSLIRDHKKLFQISNVGDFPVEVESVSIGGHGSEFNGFSISNSSGIYEIHYFPDFKTSRVTEKIIVSTKYSETEFTIQAYIPIYILKYLDNNFRITEIEESIGNWYYLIIFFFAFITLILFGTELLEYGNFMRQRKQNIEAIQNMYNEYKEESLLRGEEKAVSLLKFMQSNNIERFSHIHKQVFDCYAKTASYYDENSITRELRLLNTKFEFEHDSRSSSVSSKKNKNQNIPQNKVDDPSNRKNSDSSAKVETKQTKASKIKPSTNQNAQNPIENASVGKQQNKNKKKEVIQEVSKPAEDPKRASKQKQVETKDQVNPIKLEVNIQEPIQTPVIEKLEEAAPPPKETPAEQIKPEPRQKGGKKKGKHNKADKRHKNAKVQKQEENKQKLVEEPKTTTDLNDAKDIVKQKENKDEVDKPKEQNLSKDDKDQPSVEEKEEKSKKLEKSEIPIIPENVDKNKGSNLKDNFEQESSKSTTKEINESKMVEEAKVIKEEKVIEEVKVVDETKTIEEFKVVDESKISDSVNVIEIPKNEEIKQNQPIEINNSNEIETEIKSDIQSKEDSENKFKEVNKNKDFEDNKVSEPDQNMKIKEELHDQIQIDKHIETEQHSSYDNSNEQIVDNDEKDEQQQEELNQENNEASDPSNHQSESEHPKSFYSEGEEIDEDADDKEYQDYIEQQRESQTPKQHFRNEGYGRNYGQQHSYQNKNQNRYNDPTYFQRNQEGRYNAFHKNDYKEQKYYKVPYYDYSNYKEIGYNKRPRVNKWNQDQNKTSSYQDYKKGLREQNKMNKLNFQRQDPYKYQNTSYDGRGRKYYNKGQGPFGKRNMMYSGQYSGKESYHDNSQNYGNSYDNEKYYDEQAEYNQDDNNFGEYNQECYNQEEDDQQENEEEKFYKEDYKQEEHNEYEELEDYNQKSGRSIEIEDQFENQEDSKDQVEQPLNFFDEEPSGNPYNMFSNFREQNKDFNLFASLEDNFYGMENLMNFEFLDDPSHSRIKNADLFISKKKSDQEEGD